MTLDLVANCVRLRAQVRTIRTRTQRLRERMLASRASMLTRFQKCAPLRVAIRVNGRMALAESPNRLCPTCLGGDTRPDGEVRAMEGVIKALYRCESCGHPFLRVQRPPNEWRAWRDSNPRPPA